ncbi:MAG: NADH:ubiquinone reductase (Na(+)-transporting) subunit C [Chlamydiia bacterium]|nr:NADH:ubiquinone reductase (Na(+)-transporting) subunit C [Chlamydiia bacterium]
MSPEAPRRFTTVQTLRFIVTLSVVAAMILSVLASLLEQPKENARVLDRSEQMLIAAHVMNHEGYFVLPNDKGMLERAMLTDQLTLKVDPQAQEPGRNEVLSLYRKRFEPYFVNDKGEKKSAKDLGIDVNDYVAKYKKEGYYTQPWKLLYEILPNQPEQKDPVGYVIPINGFGLWDAIYGYLAINPDGNTVIGTTWYEQKETPGLGANIADAAWQSQFPGKVIFQPSTDGETDFKRAPIGITVVKGKVSEVIGDKPKARNAVDGMSGATLTGNGVTDAYKDVLEAYRPFLVKLHDGGKGNG